MATYRYDGPDGQMTLKLRDGAWHLTLFGQEVGIYTSPEDAAADVAAHNTGNELWDEMTDADAPETLDDWFRE